MNQIVKPFVALAPATRITDTASNAVNLLPKFDKLLTDGGRELGGALPGVKRTVETIASMKGCAINPQLLSCTLLFALVGGYNYRQTNLSRMAVYLTHAPMGTSLWTLDHFLQSRKSGDFLMFDRGETENMKLYGQPKPPRYELEKITNPYIAVIYSRGDTYASEKDAVWLKNQIKGVANSNNSYTNLSLAQFR